MKHPGKIIDLSLPYNSTVKGFSREQTKRIDKDGWNASTLTFYSHSGTHMDAPVHFDVSNQAINDIPLEDCILRAVRITVSNLNPGDELSADILSPFTGDELAGKGVIIQTGWSKYIDQPDIYRNQLPRISTGLAEELVARKVKLVGVEPPSIADVNKISEVTRIHRILLSGGIRIVEGLTHLDRITADWFTFYAIPLHIENGDGSPVRAFAIIK